MVEFRPDIERRRYTPHYALAAKTNVRSRKVNTLLEECGPILERLYRAIQTVSGAGVIVDSSKRFSYAVLLSLLPFADLRVVHLVRDSRAVAYSWGRTKESPAVVGGRLMPRMSPAQASRAWSIQNYPYTFLSGLAYLSRLRYEDFVSNPTFYLAETLIRVGFDDEAGSLHDVIRGREISLSVDHTVSGNPSRFRTGKIELQPDEEWKVKMRGADKNVVTALTAPLLLKYGYLGRSKGPNGKGTELVSALAGRSGRSLLLYGGALLLAIVVGAVLPYTERFGGDNGPYILLGVLLAIAVAGAILLQWRLGALLLAAALPFETIINFGPVASGMKALASLTFVSFALALLMDQKLFERFARLWQQPLALAVLAFVLWISASILWASDKGEALRATVQFSGAVGLDGRYRPAGEEIPATGVGRLRIQRSPLRARGLHTASA